MKVLLFRKVWVASTVACLIGASAHAALAPYSADTNTLHLWHLDEVASPSADAAAGGTNLTALANGGTLNNTSFLGFGGALSTVDGGVGGGATAAAIDAYLAPRTLANSGTDNVEWSFANPVSGAFTYEAIVWIGFNPTANLGTVGSGGTGRNLTMQIFSGDQDGVGGGIRSWQFRLDPVGINPNADGYVTPLTEPALEFININNGSSIQNFVAPLPLAGADAIVSNGWFHVAVTYDGNENTPNNLKIYWTRLEASRESASLLSSRQMTLDLAPGGVDVCLGNTGRGTPNGNFIGLIDEVRVSSIARSATNFYWQPLPPVDTDGDGLSDTWETNYFGGLSQTATNDPDSDTFNNLSEYQAGSNPTNALSTPLDVDADGLPDAWEQQYFNSISQGANGDPDGDGFTNLQEYNEGTNPAYSASNPNDSDADGLPDAWEEQYFGSVTQSPGGDADGDGFSNLQELQAGTNPNSVESFPAGPKVKLMPIDDGNPNTSEYGYGGNSSINAVCFTRESLMTVSNQQFMAYYYRHQSSASDPGNNRIVIARRDINTNIWEIFRTPFTANNITDGHDTVSFGIDGEGYMHMSWGMHGDAFHYSRSTNPVVGNLPIGFGPDTTMTGSENAVTYPQFLTMPNGDLLYLFREGGSGDGDSYVNRWSLATHSWTNVNYSGGQQPFIRGSSWTPDYNAYPLMPQLDPDGNLFFIWDWRYNGDSPAGEAGYQTNHDFDYARSTNGGVTWLRQSGVPYALPINEDGENGNTNSIAEKILSIPEGYSLINQASLCLDSSNRPVIGTWWAPGSGTNNYRRQYMVAFPDSNNVWHVRQVSNRTNDPTATKYSETFVRDLGRPVIVADRADRLIAIYRDNFGSNGLTVVYSLPRALDPQRTNWTTLDLTTDNLGFYETQIDNERWKRDNVLHVLYQPAQGFGYNPPANTASQIGVLEWDVAAYFAHRPTLRLSLSNNTNALLSFNTQLGWDYRVQTSTNLSDWNTLATLSGITGTRQYTHTNSIGGTQRYWRVQSQEGGFAP